MDLRDIPPLPSARIPTLVQYMPQTQEAAAPPPAAKHAVGEVEIWGDTLNSLLRMCNMTSAADLHTIWDVINPLSRDRARSDMEAYCLRKSEHLRFRAPHISHAVAVLVLGLTFYSEDLDGVGDAINVFIFPDLYSSAGSEAALLARRWDIILGGGALTSFSETSLLLAKQRVEPVTSWEAAKKQLESWGVFCHVFFGNADVHLATYEVFTLAKETAYVGARLRAQTQRQPDQPVSLLSLLHTQFNESSRQALERQHRVRWPDFEWIQQELATWNFRPENIALPGAFKTQAPTARAPSTGTHASTPLLLHP